jgi:hypothetical protein
VAIDQDGKDISYVVAVTFGDGKEEYNLLLDSAASNTWIMSQDCDSEACKMHNTFGKGDSSTLTVCMSLGYCLSHIGILADTATTDTRYTL